MLSQQTKIGLALSSGGAKGIAHVGVLRALEDARIPIHLLVGSSMGGLVAAFYAAGHSTAEIEQLCRSMRLFDIIQRDRSGMGLLGQDRIAALLQGALGDLTFDQLNLPLALVAADLETGEEVIICEGSVVEGMLATMALPVIFPPRHWNGRLLIDGGVINPIPFDIARQMGADHVIAVHTRHALPSIGEMLETTPLHRGQGARAAVRTLRHRSRWSLLHHISERSVGIMSRRLIEQRLQEAPPDLMIEVLFKDVELLDLDQIDLCLAAGENAARQCMSKLIEIRDTSLRTIEPIGERRHASNYLAQSPSFAH
ncbi:MAG: patatin-like phospholipase family protein [Chloroflexota bacterium]|nr:patatin-like phospholipase family protein [Chloroflexota bacterium]